MLRYTKPLFTSMTRMAQRSLLVSSSFRTATSTPAANAPVASGKSGSSEAEAAGRIKGAPPISIEDLYGLLFMSEPPVVALERAPKDMFESDVKLSEVFCYINGGYGVPRDDRTRNALWDMLRVKTLIGYRDAGNKPELRKVLKEASGTDELPQLYISGKCVAKGKDFEDITLIKKILEPTVRPWPRNGPYQSGFDGYIGITQTDQLHQGTWKPKTTGAAAAAAAKSATKQE